MAPAWQHVDMARFTTQRGLDRLVNFSDATVAIAATLLVLPLTDLAGQVHDIGLESVLIDHLSEITSFVISFMIIAVIWSEHHRLFEWVVSYDGPLLVLNFVWLLAIVTIPFSTALTQDVDMHDRVSSALYLGIMLLAFVALAAMYVVARHDKRVLDPERRDEFEVGPSIAMAVLCAIALVVAMTVPAIGRWSVFLLVLSDPIWLAVRKVTSQRPGR